MPIRATCPACGTEGDLVLWIEHAAAREAIVQVATGGMGNAKRAVQYVGLFAPAQRRLGLDRAAKLLAEVAALYRTLEFQFDGRTWPGEHGRVPLDRAGIDAAIDKMLEARAAGKLVPPLQNHHYLYRILSASLAELDGRAERLAEAGRKDQARSGGAAAVAATTQASGINVDKGFSSQAEMRAEMQRRAAAASPAGAATRKPEVSDDGI
jgi:hypothetical protein